MRWDEEGRRTVSFQWPRDIALQSRERYTPRTIVPLRRKDQSWLVFLLGGGSIDALLFGGLRIVGSGWLQLLDKTKPKKSVSFSSLTSLVLLLVLQHNNNRRLLSLKHSSSQIKSSTETISVDFVFKYNLFETFYFFSVDTKVFLLLLSTKYVLSIISFFDETTILILHNLSQTNYVQDTYRQHVKTLVKYEHMLKRRQ